MYSYSPLWQTIHKLLPILSIAFFPLHNSNKSYWWSNHYSYSSPNSTSFAPSSFARLLTVSVTPLLLMNISFLSLTLGNASAALSTPSMA